jgi:hypothetical protein
MTSLIISKLESKSIILTNMYRSNYKKVAINEIIRALKIKLNYRALFNRVKNTNKNIEEVNKTLKSMKKTLD